MVLTRKYKTTKIERIHCKWPYKIIGVVCSEMKIVPV